MNMVLETKELKPYKGFMIEKSYELKNKTIVKDSIIYTAYDKDGDIFDASKTIRKIKNKIDIYMQDMQAKKN